METYRDKLKNSISDLINDFKIDNGIDKLKEDIETNIDTLMDEVEINPNPLNPNAIYYSDGSVVEVGDTWKFTGMGENPKSKSKSKIKVDEGLLCLDEKIEDNRIINIHGSLGYLTFSGTMPMPFVCNFNVEWDNNRMTNVSKVVK